MLHFALLSALAAPAADADLTVPFEQFTLDNGLTVVLHQDRSDPIVAVATVVHVGSNREVAGRTGFAHFFEHMAFNDSENVPRGANRKRIEELGGSRNGGTSRDYTIYYEVVPSDSLEKILWIDSDRLGFMINTVTEGALENEKQVVKNEKRQRVDNAPYGFTGTVIAETLYGSEHPYGWPVIGSLADLQAATLDDVRTFYDRWYGPNNATLVLAGDFEIEPTKKLVQDYFGEIAQGPEVTDPEPKAVTLDETVSLHHLDSFAKLPELRLTFPTVALGHDDVWALDALGEILSDGKRAPLYRELVEERQIASRVSAWQNSGEMAGTFTIRVRAADGVDLDVVLEGVNEALADFAENGFDEADLARIKARQERAFYQRMGSVLNKARTLALGDVLHGDAGYVTTDLERTKAVTTDDVTAVFERWVADKPHIQTSFVPKDAPDLVVEGSTPAEVVEEAVVKGAEAPPAVVEDGDYEKTPTTFDRSSEPDFGPPSDVPPPEIRHAKRDDGLEVWVIEQTETPLVQFSIAIDGGHRIEPIEKSGMASLLAELLNEGTANKTPEQLEDALGALGADLRISGGRDNLTLQGSCLSSQFDTVFDLAVEMLTQPRFDEAEFTRILADRPARFASREGNARTLAGLALNTALFGPDHPYAWPPDGTPDTVAGITLKDLKKHHKKTFMTSATDVHVVGDVSMDVAEAAAARLAAGMKSKPVKAPVFAAPLDPSEPMVVFVDVPGSKQSVLYAASISMPRNDPAYFDLDVAHRRLGGGSSGQLFQTLRIQKGYTYGMYSFASSRVLTGLFGMGGSVRANVTLESMEIMRDLTTGYADGFTEDELTIAKTLIRKGEAVKFETLGARLRHLEMLSQHGLPVDLLDTRRKRLDATGLDDVKASIGTWMKTDDLIWVVVGDGETQRAEVEKFGLPVVDIAASDVNAVSRGE